MMIAIKLGLLEDVLHAHLHLPALAVVEAVVVGLRVVFAIGVFLHGVCGLACGVHTLILEHTASVAGLGGSRQWCRSGEEPTARGCRSWGSPVRTFARADRISTEGLSTPVRTIWKKLWRF